MAHRKWIVLWSKLVFLVIFVCSIKANSQSVEFPQLYGGLGYYRHTSFDADSYYHARIGAQILSYRFISPEIDFTYYFGGNERAGERDAETGFPTSILYKNFRGKIWGVAPKLFLGDNDLRWVFIPKYHFGNVSAEGLLNADRDQLGRTERKDSKSTLNFWSFSIGAEGSLNKERFKIGVYLNYTRFDAGEAMNKIQFATDGFGESSLDTSTLGLAVRISYLLWNNENK